MSGGSKTQTTTSQAQIPSFLQPYLSNQANTGNSALSNINGMLQNAGADQLVAGFNPNQVAGQNLAISQATNPNGPIGTAQGALTDIAKGDWITQNSQQATQNILAGANTPNLANVDVSQLKGFADNAYQLSSVAQNALDSSAAGGGQYGTAGFDEAVQASIRAARPSILSGFAGSGGNGALKSGLAQTAMQQAASDSFARLYGDERNRQLASANSLGQFGLNSRGLAQGAAGQVVDAGVAQRGQDVQQQALRNQMAMGMGQLLGSERDRQLQASNSLPGIGMMGSDVLRDVGGEQQRLSQAQLTAPLTAQQMLLDASSGGMNMNGLIGQTSSQPIYKNTGAGILGGAATGAQIGSMFGPMGTGIGAIGGGLLGLF